MNPACGAEPPVTVLMAVRDGAQFLREAVESVLAQSFKEFEFLVIDDGSTDATCDILGSYRDHRIRVVSNERPLGLAASLNRGLELAKGIYIARMDCDDVSLPIRLEKQVAFMDANLDVAVCGTWVRTIGVREGDLWQFPTRDRAIKASFIFHTPLAHPSVIIRKQALDAHALRYDESVTKAQDYDFWVRCALYVGFANIPEALLLYRLHPRNLSSDSSDAKYSTARDIRLRQIQALGIKPTVEEIELHESLAMYRYRADEDFLVNAERWFEKLALANGKTHRYSEPEFSDMLKERWFAACVAATRRGLPVWAAYRKSRLLRGYQIPLRMRMGFLLRCLAGH